MDLLSECFRSFLISGLLHGFQLHVEHFSFELEITANPQKIAKPLSVVAPIRIHTHPCVQRHAADIVGRGPQDIQNPFLAELKPLVVILAKVLQAIHLSGLLKTLRIQPLKLPQMFFVELLKGRQIVGKLQFALILSELLTPSQTLHSMSDATQHRFYPIAYGLCSAAVRICNHPL